MPRQPEDSNLSSDSTSIDDASDHEASTDGDGWLTVDIDDLAPGEACEICIEGAILVISNVEGELHAMDGICAHQGGPLGKGKLSGCTLTCPWHGWQYDVASGRQTLSKVIAQRTYPIRRLNDTIQVCLGGEDLAKDG